MIAADPFLSLSSAALGNSSAAEERKGKESFSNLKREGRHDNIGPVWLDGVITEVEWEGHGSSCSEVV